MFKNLINLATSSAAIVDATVGLVTKPVTDGAQFVADSLNELLPDDK